MDTRNVAAGPAMTAAQEHRTQGRGWGKVSILLLTRGHLPCIEEWRQEWLTGFGEGVAAAITELRGRAGSRDAEGSG